MFIDVAAATERGLLPAVSHDACLFVLHLPLGNNPNFTTGGVTQCCGSLIDANYPQHTLTHCLKTMCDTRTRIYRSKPR